MESHEGEQEPTPEKSGLANPAERSDDNADDVTGIFRDPRTDERLRVSSLELPDVPEPIFQRPDAPQKAGGKTAAKVRGRVPLGSIETAGDTRKTALASSVGILLVASMLVGAGIGWVIDHFILHDPPTPWGMVCGLMLGVVAGFYNVARIAKRLQDDGGDS